MTRIRSVGGDRAESFWSLIVRRAAQSPGELMAVDDLDRRITFAEYRDRAEAAAAGLTGLGVGPGVAVSWLLPTWIEALVLAGAFARLGAVQNPIIPVAREREVSFATRQTQARLLVVPSVWKGFDYAAMAESVAADQPQLAVVVVDRSDGDALDFGSPGDLPAPEFEPAVRWHFYTSGTTSAPKGVRHTDASLIASARGVNHSVEVGPTDRMGVVFPYTHVGGIALLVGAMLAGYGQILVEAFDPPVTIPILSRHGVTVAGAGTVFWNAYLDAQSATPDVPIFPALRAVVGGGSAKPPTIHARVRDELGGRGVISGYGLTECPSCVLGQLRDTEDQLALGDGRPVVGAEVRIVDAEGGQLGPNEAGEIWVRGPMLCAGYVDPALDAEAFTDDGWLRTGDLGRVDFDGYLFVTGRLKEIVIRKGENISAREVEEVLILHPSVRDVVVIGLADDERGELACAVVVLRDGAELSFAAMAAHCRAQGLATYKTPERLEFVSALPRSPAGKVLRREILDRFAPS